MELFSLAALIALGMKLVDFVKFVTNRDWNSAVTQLAAWGAGILVVFLGAASNVTKAVAVNGTSLGQLNDASKVLAGLSLLSVGSVVYGFKKAIDNTDSAATPALLPGNSGDLSK